MPSAERTPLVPVILVVTGAALLAAAGGAAWQGATTLEQRVAVYDRAELRRPPEPDPLPPDRVVQPVRIRLRRQIQIPCVLSQG